MKYFFTISVFCVAVLYTSLANAQVARYWVGSSIYQNNFSASSELDEWTLTDDNGSGSWALSGNGSAILTMDDALGSFTNKIVNETAGIPNLVPLDAVNGRINLQIVGLTGGDQEFFLQVQEFDVGGTYITEQTVLSAQNTIGDFTVFLNAITWNVQTTQVTFVIGGQNLSASQGTIEIGYFNYNNTDNNWSTAVNWSATSGGAGGASVPGISDTAYFDQNSGNCTLDIPVSVSRLNMLSSFPATIAQNATSLTVGAGGAVLNGGTLRGGSADINFSSVTLGGTNMLSTSSTLFIQGNCSFTSGSFSHNSGMVEFNGTTLQQLTNSPGFELHHVTINNSMGVSLNDPLAIDGVIFLQQGILYTNSDTLDLGTDGSIVELPVSPSSYVQGYVRAERNIGSTIENQSFGGIGLVINESNLPTNSTVVVRETGVATKFTGIKRYFDIIPSVNLGLSATLEFSYFEGELGDVVELSLGLFKAPLPFNSSDPQWLQQATAVFNVTSNTITVNNIADFSRWTAGSVEPLPVALISFTAVAESNVVSLQWLAEAEKNSYFFLSKSVDGTNFTEFAKIAAVDNDGVFASYHYSDDMTAGVSYYRLSYTDANGVLQYSKVVSVQNNSSLAFNAYTNQNGELTVKLMGETASEGSSLQIVDLLGHTVYSGAMKAGSSEEVLRLNVYSGVYTVTLRNGNSYALKKITIQ